LGGERGGGGVGWVGVVHKYIKEGVGDLGCPRIKIYGGSGGMGVVGGRGYGGGVVVAWFMGDLEVEKGQYRVRWSIVDVGENLKKGGRKEVESLGTRNGKELSPGWGDIVIIER